MSTCDELLGIVRSVLDLIAVCRYAPQLYFVCCYDSAHRLNVTKKSVEEKANSIYFVLVSQNDVTFGLSGYQRES